MTPLFFYLACLLIFNLSYSQYKEPIDTSDVSFRNELEKDFDGRVLKQETIKNLFSDEKAFLEFEKNYKEKNEEFKKLIKKGIFIEDKKYKPFVEELFLKIKNANPDFDLNDIKILLAISEEDNAYNVGEGIVVLNLSLIGKFENQYQLASVITHEIAHQKLNHVINSMKNYAVKTNSKDFISRVSTIEKQKYNKNNSASLILKQFVYNRRSDSRRNEQQADSLGFVLFSKTFPNYKDEAIKTLQILKNLDEEKDSLTSQDFARFFGTPKQVFKNEWLNKGVLENYKYQKGNLFWEVDSLRTHPDCEARVLSLKKGFSIQNVNKKIVEKDYQNIISESEKEYVYGLYFLKEYGKSLYNTLLFYKKETEVDLFYKKMILQNLIQIREARNKYTLNKFLETENPKFSKSYNQFLSLIWNLRKQELNEIISYYEIQ